MLGDAQVQDGVGATITRNKCWGSLSLVLAIFFKEVLNWTLRVPCLFLGTTQAMVNCWIEGWWE